MSVTSVPIGVLLLLQQHGLLAGHQSACDFGSMEFDAREPANNRMYESLFERLGGAIPAELYDTATGRIYGPAADFWRALGWDYRSYDIDGRWGSTAIDLNTEQIPDADRGTSTLTMNLGTAEHVFNQSNFFTQCHDVTRVGGLMMHIVPFDSLHNHGLYAYERSFFYSLAQYNHYDLLGMWQCGKPQLNVYRSAHAKPDGRRIVLIAVLRRTEPAAFAMPLQVNEPMVLSPEAEGRYGAFVPRALDDFRAVGGLPDEFHVDVPTATLREGPSDTKVPKKAKK